MSVKAINMSGSPAPAVGVGGLGLIALGVVVTAVRPEAWGLLLSGVMGGILLGISMVLVRRRGVSASATRMLFPGHGERS